MLGQVQVADEGKDLLNTFLLNIQFEGHWDNEVQFDRKNKRN